MIIDSHAHAFPPMGGPSGFVSSERHAMYTQHGLAHTTSRSGGSPTRRRYVSRRCATARTLRWTG